MLDKGDILAIQSKISLIRPKSMRKVDGLSLIFISFYVPVLTPYLNSTEALRTQPSSWCRTYTGFFSKDRHQAFGVYHLYILYLYTVGDRTEPCGTPGCISLTIDILPSETLNFLWKRKEQLSLIKLIEHFNSDQASQGAMLYQRLLLYWRILQPLTRYCWNMWCGPYASYN
jgi:hypothetical protein